MDKNPSPTDIAGTGMFPVYPSPLPVGEPDYLSCHASIRPKEAQHRYFGSNLNNHIYSLCSRNPSSIFSHHLRQQHKHACLTSARAPRFLSSVSLPPLLVLLATSLLLGISETPTPIPGWRRNVSDCKVTTPSVIVYRYAVPVGYLLPDQYPTGTRMGKNHYPRQLTGTGTGTGWILRSGEENVPAIPVRYIPVAIRSQGRQLVMALGKLTCFLAVLCLALS